jgi:hypothetical protein
MGQQLGFGNESTTWSTSNEVGHVYAPVYNVGGTGNYTGGYSGRADYSSLFATDEDNTQESTGSLGLGIGGGSGSGGEVTKGGNVISSDSLLASLSSFYNNNKLLVLGIAAVGLIAVTMFVVTRKKRRK